MLTEELKTFISKMRAAGRIDADIAAELKKAGWVEADIMAALSSETQSQPAPQVTPAEPKSKIWLYIFITLVAVWAGGYLTIRALPYLLARSLKKQGFSSVVYPKPTAIPTPSSYIQPPQNLLIAFPQNLIQFTIPDSWYTKKEISGQNNYQMQFVYKTDPEGSEDYPEYALQITVTYPAGQSAEINNLNKIVAVLRSSFSSAADGEKVNAATSDLDLSENLQNVTNETSLPGKFNLLVDQAVSVAGLPGHTFEYTNEINKVVNKKEKDATGKFVETTTNVHRVEHVHDLIVFDRKNNLIVIEFKATDANWSSRVGDFDQIAGSFVILYK